MGTKIDPSENLTEAQRAAIDAARESHKALVAAQTHVEAALGAAQIGREQAWAKTVMSDLKRARDVLSTHRMEVQSPKGLYAEIRSDAPHLAERVDALVEDLRTIEERVALLVEELRRVSDGEHRHLLDVRPDAAHMMTAIRRLMAMESDIIFERFNDLAPFDA